MKIVIDIPEELYKRVKTKYIPLPHDFADVMDNAINNSTPFEQECYITGEQWNQFMKEHRRPHGKWNITDAYPHKVYCNKCFKTYAQENWEVWKEDSLPRNFCPNCGADMRKEEEG